MIMRITSSSRTSATASVPMLLPLRRTVSRSQKRRTSRSRCEMNTMVTPSRRSRSICAPSQSMSRPDSVEVGSSSSRMRGRRNSARAISIFCRTARSRSPTSARGSMSASPIAAKCASTSRSPARRRNWPSRPRGARGSSMFSATVRSRISVSSWNAVCTPWRCASRRARQHHLPAEQLDPAAIGQDQSGQQLDHRGLAGAVLAEQRVHRRRARR